MLTTNIYNLFKDILLIINNKSKNMPITDRLQSYIYKTEAAEEKHYDAMHSNEDDVKKSKKGHCKYYPSNKQQALIKNALTGLPYLWRVGTIDEKRLFKVVDTTGTCDGEGYLIRRGGVLPNPNPNHLYYDSPDQCMSHLNLTFEKALIDSWRHTRNDLFGTEE
jgi:hypothetical protein